MIANSMDTGKRSAAEELLEIIFDNSPLASSICGDDGNPKGCNAEAIRMFNLRDKQEFIENFHLLSPIYQPDGTLSKDKATDYTNMVLKEGRQCFEWCHQDLAGNPIPCEITLTCINFQNKPHIISYIRDLRLIKEAEKMAFIDALTGVRNRRYLMEVIEQQFLDCVEQNKIFSIFMLDVDHFKHINDQYGHTVGDEVLKILTLRVCNELKDDTDVVRYGGEEFIVFLPGVNYENALKTAQRIHKTITSSAFHIGDLSLNITASFGVADNKYRSLLELISAADKALYEAKDAGRDRVR